MNCEELKRQLPGFHFGELVLESRSEVETHLAGCLSCVSAMLTFKRVVELNEGGPRPSTAARQSLRAAMVAELNPGWLWWERPTAVVMAASAVLLAISVVQSLP